MFTHLKLRLHDPQLQVSETTHMCLFEITHLQILLFVNIHFIPNDSDLTCSYNRVKTTIVVLSA